MMESLYELYFREYGALPPDRALPLVRPDLTVAGILNQSTAGAFAQECRLLVLTEENWQQLLSTQAPGFLLCQPLINGNGETEQLWPRQETDYKAITDFCRTYGIPTVYWDTAGPTCFPYNKNNALLFDHLFVSDPSWMALYGKAGRPEVHFLPRGIARSTLSPIKTACFAPGDTMMTKPALRVLRENMSTQTLTHRIGTILSVLGVPDKFRSAGGVTVITATNKQGYMQNIFSNYDRQTYEPKELVVLLNNDSLDLAQWQARAALSKNVRVFRIDACRPLGHCLNHAIDNSSLPYVTKMDDDNYYAPDFLTDLVNGFYYADAEIVGKLSYFIYLESSKTLILMCPGMEHRYVNFVSGSALVIKRSVFDAVRFSDVPVGSDSVFLSACVKQGVRLYSADRYNYVYKRRASKEDHTSPVPDQVFLQSCQYIGGLPEFEAFISA